MINTVLIPPKGIARNYRHGYKTSGKYSSEYSIWINMRSRCNNPNNTRYQNYGARGIKVCAKWEEDFMNFLNDMGRRPSKKHSIDRINNDGDYSKENCRWTDIKTQCRNRTTNRFIEFEGESKTVAEWAEIREMSPSLIYSRLAYGWTGSKALTEPVRGTVKKDTNGDLKKAIIRKELPF